MLSQFEFDFAPKPRPASKIAAFPMARTSLVAQVSSDMRDLLTAEEREWHWQLVCRRLLSARRADGLTHNQAKADVIAFRDAVRAALPPLPSGPEAQIISLDQARADRAQADATAFRASA